MSDSTQSSETASSGVFGGNNEPLTSQPVFVAPSTGQEFNAISIRLNPVACWRVDDMRFEFGLSFVKPDLKDELQLLYSLKTQHAGAPLSIYGHADPVGRDQDNKALSGRRAKAIYALLTRKVELWETLYENPSGSDRWNTQEIQIMLSALQYYPGPINGQLDQQTEDAVREFQTDNDLVVDGIPGPNSRAKLFKAYMDLICVDQDDKPYQLNPEIDFLAQGQDSNGKGDYQGCSEFNPLLLFSEQEQQEYEGNQDNTQRNAENAPNRRVIVFLFQAGSRVNIDKWPCPSAEQGMEQCKKRFWHDGETRRSSRLPEERRKFEDTRDTFACRFYQRLSTLSPCEGAIPMPSTECHISVLLRSNSGAMALADRPYRIRLDDGRILGGRTDQDGLIIHTNVPPGDYPLELDCEETGTLVPTSPTNVERIPLRVINKMLFEYGESDDTSPDDPDENAQVSELSENSSG